MPGSNEKGEDMRPLSERPLGYLLATGGGILGGPIGLIVSPVVLLILNSAMKPSGEKKPNRFRAWALIGILGAPLSLGIFGATIPSEDVTNSDTQGTSAVSTNNSNTAKTTQVKPSAKPKSASITIGEFTLSNITLSPYNGDAGNADVAGKLWAAYGDVTNNGNETEVPAYSMSTSVIDSEGKSFKAADMTVNMNSIVDEAFGGQKVLRFTDGVLPGSTRKNVQIGIFDVSPGAEGLRLCAKALFGRTKCAG